MNLPEDIELPPQFSELEQFVRAWCKESMSEQYAARLRSDMATMQPFYEAVKSRIVEIRDYLDGLAFDDYTEADAALGRMAIAWVPVAEAIEVFKQVRVPDSKGYWDIVQEPQSF